MAKIIYSKNAPEPIGPYSQAVLAGGMLYCSGAVPLDPVSGDIVGDAIEEQTEQVMKNISAVLAAAGADFTAVVKATCFLKSMDDFAAFNGIYAKYFTGKPARSCVEVSRLPKDVLVEVEVIAVVG
ncbi:MAG: RidA family protein [Oscillospiraceae bacterium]|nr:RidA family protein [Oscillospiraceae bacterium]